VIDHISSHSQTETVPEPHSCCALLITEARSHSTTPWKNSFFVRMDTQTVRRSNHRLSMRQYAFLIIRPQLSSPNPNFSKPRTKTANSDFWSRLNHKLMGRLKSTIPNLQIYLPNKANSKKLGLGIDNPRRIVLLSLRMNKCLERVNDRHFWNPGVFSYAMIPRCHLNLSFFFFPPSHL
jgi:hypothetical protein